MTLWHIIRFTTIRHFRLTEIYLNRGGRPWQRKLLREEWIPVKQRKAVAWDPNLLHQFLKGETK